MDANRKSMQMRVAKDLVTALSLPRPAVVSIIGSGGKTTLMYRLAKELVQQNKKVITTTTTKIYPPMRTQSPYIYLCDKRGIEPLRKQGQPLLKKLDKYQQITLAAGKNNENKLVGLDPEIVDNLADNLLKNGKLDYILVEADGAKGKSLKGYRIENPKSDLTTLKLHQVKIRNLSTEALAKVDPQTAIVEPVIPKSSKLCVLVLGWDILEKPLNERYVHRAKILSKLIHAKMNTKISISTLIDALCLPEGYISRVPSKCKLIIFINKVNYISAKKRFMQFCQGLIRFSPRPIDRIIIGTLQDSNIYFTQRPQSRRKVR